MQHHVPEDYSWNFSYKLGIGSDRRESEKSGVCLYSGFQTISGNPGVVQQVMRGSVEIGGNDGAGQEMVHLAPHQSLG